jgi:hypothetical protein
MFENYYSYFLPQLILQIICVLHAIKKGKDRSWIYIIVFIPFVGGIVYFFAEILPSLRSNGIIQTANEQVGNALFPARRIKELEQQIELADTYQNRILLGEAYAAAARYEDALAMFNKALTGIYKDDPFAIGKRALTYYVSGNHQKALQDFEHALAVAGKLNEKEQLIYAMILETMGKNNEALKAYEKAVMIATGLEAEYRQGKLIQKLGDENKAQDIFEHMIRKAKSSPGYFRRKESKWINLAKEELKVLS